MQAKNHLLLAFLIVLVSVSPITLAMQPPNVNGNISVVIKGYDDGVIVDSNVSLMSTINRTVEEGGQLKIIIESKSEMPSENQMITNGILDIIATSDVLKENNVNANIWLTYNSVKDYGELYLKAIGNYTNINGTLDFNVELKGSGNANNTTVDLEANVTIPVKMIGEDAVQQLVMMSAFLNERTVNLYLEQLNMTFIKFRTLTITTSVDKQKNLVYMNIKAVFYINATEALMHRGTYGVTPIMGGNITTQPSFPVIQTPFTPAKNINSSGSMNATIKTVDNQLKINVKFHVESKGDLEKATRENHERFIKMLKESNATIPPGLDEIYIAPSPVDFKLTIDATKPGEVKIDAVLRDLRLKHVNLTGVEAQKRTAAIILGYLAALQQRLPSSIAMTIQMVNLEKTEPDPEIKEKAADYLENFMRNIPVIMPTPSNTTVTLTTTYTTITVTTSTTTTTTTQTTPTTTSQTTSTHATTQTTTTSSTTTSQTTIQTTSPTSPVTSSTTTTPTTTGGTSGEGWTWITVVAVVTVIIVVVAVILLLIVLKKR